MINVNDNLFTNLRHQITSWKTDKVRYRVDLQLTNIYECVCMVQFTQHTQFNLGDEVNNITQAHQLALNFVAKYERKEAITILLLYK